MNGAGNGHPKERLSEYLDDRLGVEDRASMDRHLAECPDCRVELDALRRLASAIADEEMPPVPVDLAARIGRKLDAATGVRPQRRRFVVPATIAATITAIGILVTLQWRDGRLGAPPIPSTPPEAAAVPREEAKEDARRDAPSGKQGVAPAPSVEPSDTKSEQGVLSAVEGGAEGGAPGGVPGGVVGGVVGGVENETDRLAERRASADEGRLAPLQSIAKDSAAAPVSPCVDRWSDSGVRGSWEVPDIDAAARGLSRISQDVGGVGLWRGIDDGRPFVVVVPRDRFEEIFYALRARGVGGLDALPALDPGTDCKGISVALVAPKTPGEGPR